ncbi:uncharacterized protein LOC130712499 [Lotus japonicus]|uniref:uncharacterized protein LOC130712499 n=1 Tax=Lotus japonicus TaxID=34305 RepID=UPI00258E4C95|nr:uncharacterized protein LOC130712499 [Lotus japonicus]
MDMILMDKFGTKIQGSVCRKHPTICAMLDGRVYRIFNFKVVLNDDIRLTPHEFRLIFHTCTIIVESFDVRIPRNGWSFYNTQIIRNMSDEFTHLIDCLGVISVASHEKLFIKDSQLTKISKVHFNPDIEEDVELTQRMDVLGFNYHGLVGFIRPNDSNLSLRDDMLNAHLRKTLTQLLDNKEGRILIFYASMVGVLRDGQWFYPSCRCYSELRINGVKYDCLKCGRITDKMINRFRFKVKVFKGVDSAVFVLYDPEAELLTGLSCEELMNFIELEKKVILEGECPDGIEDHIAGLEMLFKAKFIPSFTKMGNAEGSCLTLSDKGHKLRKKHLVDSVIDLNDDTKAQIAEIETKDVGETKSLSADGGRDVTNDGSPNSVECEVPKSGVPFAGKELIDLGFDDEDITRIVFEEEIMEDNDSSE